MLANFEAQTFAAVISLLNDFLIASGKPPLGFLNPFIYSTGVSGFNDITSGSNSGCGTNGFTAGTGWDPVRLVISTFGELKTNLPSGHGAWHSQF